MPSISISEADFTAVAEAAYDAKRAGNRDEAQALDKIARKIKEGRGNDSWRNTHTDRARLSAEGY